jgi:hypothetical protein
MDLQRADSFLKKLAPSPKTSTDEDEKRFINRLFQYNFQSSY